MKKNNCPNLNHRRSNSPVRACPDCGGTVNPAVQERACSEEDHAARRKKMSTYCYDCGERLIGRD